MYEIRGEARAYTWTVSRSGRRGIAWRRNGEGVEHELARSERRLGVDRVRLASAVFADAVGIEPSYRLAVDLSLFLVPSEADGERSMTAAELQAWLATWKAPFEKLFPAAERGIRRVRRK
jgi:hypothetical protein